MKSVSIRLREKDLELLEKIAERSRKNRSEVARDLIVEGKKFDILKRYRKGVLSIEKAAKELGINVGEFMDFLTELGIKSPVRYEDYKEGIEALKKAF
ncbi:MAG: ribbon-helix-helix protein, CopG family [Candidatus Hadarchaeota archaeon]